MARIRRSRRPRPDLARPDLAGPNLVGPNLAGPGSFEEDPSEAGDPLCALCLRPIPPGVPQSLHHLVPKLKGGRGGPTVLLHHVCHKEVHAALSEAELARLYRTPEALRAHPRLARFAQWVARRPPSFSSRVPKRR